MGINRPIGLLAAVAIAAMTLPAAVVAQEQDPSEKAAQQGAEAETPEQSVRGTDVENLIAVASESGNYQTFVQLVGEAGLKDELETGGPFTVFAPTDEAFENLSESELDALKQDREMLVRLLRTHIAVGEWTGDQLKTSESIQNLLADELSIASSDQRGELRDVDEEQDHGAEAAAEPDAREMRAEPAAKTARGQSDLMIEDAAVIEADIMADNGVIHGIDAVLDASPEPASQDMADARKSTNRQDPRDGAAGEAQNAAGVEKDAAEEQKDVDAAGAEEKDEG